MFAENPLGRHRRHRAHGVLMADAEKGRARAMVRRQPAGLASATLSPQSPVATQNTHQTQWTSKHRPSPTAKPTPSPSGPTTVFRARGSPSRGLRDVAMTKSRFQKTQSLVFPPEAAAFLNMTQTFRAARTGKHICKAAAPSRHTHTKTTLCKIGCQFNTAMVIPQQTSLPEFRSELSPTCVSYAAT